MQLELPIHSLRWRRITFIETFKSLAETLTSGRWLAFGGGGYAVEVVPRAWTLAYGVMSGQTFADELPPAYSERYGPGRLHDTAGPEPLEDWVSWKPTSTSRRTWTSSGRGRKTCGDGSRI